MNAPQSKVRFIPRGSEPEPDPLKDATGIIAAMRRDIGEAVKPLEVLCAEGCGEWARFHDAEDKKLCPSHARAAQKDRGAKLWRYAQPDVVYALYRILAYKTALEVQGARDDFEAQRNAGTLRGTSIERMNYEMGGDLVVEDTSATT
jgi:hypothetical protein